MNKMYSAILERVRKRERERERERERGGRERERERERQTDRQTDRQTETDSQMYKKSEGERDSVTLTKKYSISLINRHFTFDSFLNYLIV